MRAKFSFGFVDCRNWRSSCIRDSSCYGKDLLFIIINYSKIYVCLLTFLTTLFPSRLSLSENDGEHYIGICGIWNNYAVIKIYVHWARSEMKRIMLTTSHLCVGLMRSRASELITNCHLNKFIIYPSRILAQTLYILW